MIGYVTLGSNDLRRAAAYYDDLLATLAGRRYLEMDNFIAWGTAPDKPMLSITRPFDGEAASVGNGVMVALAAGSPEQVQAVHAKALELGSLDEGGPGPRGDSGFYAGYFRDLDGNKLCAFCIRR